MRFVLVIELDVCSDGNHDCHPNAVCSVTEGSYNCTCHKGFIGNGQNCKGSEIGKCNKLQIISSIVFSANLL